MTEPHTTPETNPSPTGRAPDGKFAPGNQFGPGNPFARKRAAFRVALMDTVTEQDIHDIAAKLRDDAKAGDKAAVKLLFQYVIGKPQPAVDPDTLDIQEMRGYMSAAFPPEVLEEMQRGLPLSMLLKMWPFFLFAKEQTNAEAFLDRSAVQDEKQQRRAERARQKAERRQRRQEARAQARPPQEPAAAPSPNGDFGNNGFAEEGAAPSPNGDNGGMIDFFARWLHGRQLPPDGAPQA